MEDDKIAVGVSGPIEYDEVVTTKDTKMIDAVSSHIIHVRMSTACTGVRLDVMTQALCPEDGSLPQGLAIQNTYAEMCNGSKNVAIMVKNSTAYPQTLKKKKIPVARAVVANWVQESQMWPTMIEALHEAHGIQMPKLTTKQRQEKLFEKLVMSRLESWPPELADSTQCLLTKYHDIFSLEPSKLGCTHSTRHVIKVINDVLFKEQFQWIPPPLVKEVHTHLQEM